MIKTKKTKFYLGCLMLVAALTFMGCKDRDSGSTEAENTEVTPIEQRPLAIDNGKVMTENGQQLLYGGEESGTHFDISNLSLKAEQFHYGIGREAFPALLDPEFISVAAADSLWNDDARFLIAMSKNETKAYAVRDLIRHEVVNDSLDGEPIMAAYCILADLGAIYTRRYGDQTLTFALSGYTYFDPEVWDGMDGFVFWDRETESLWWPLIGEAVSGRLKGAQLLEKEKSTWMDICQVQLS